MKYYFVESDITELSMDAVVMPARDDLEMHPGVSEMIFKRAGKKLAADCRKISSCEPGYAVPTSGYNLYSTYVIHAVVPQWDDGLHNEYGLLASAYLSALKMADIMLCRTIAFPIMGTGHHGFDFDMAFDIAVKAIDSFVPEHLEHVLIVLYDDAACAKALSHGCEILKNDLDFVQPGIPIKEHFGIGRDVVMEMMYKRMDQANEWMSDSANRTKLLLDGMGVVTKVLAI